MTEPDGLFVRFVVRVYPRVMDGERNGLLGGVKDSFFFFCLSRFFASERER